MKDFNCKSENHLTPTLSVQRGRKARSTFAEGGATHVDTCDKVRRSAFTLAEVLIVLAIIGVISVLTLPNVMQSYNKKVTVAQLQRTYNALKNAYSDFLTNEQVDTLGESSVSVGATEGDEAKNFLNNKYLDIAKVCGCYGFPNNEYETRKGSDCVAEKYTLTDKTTTYTPDEFHYCVILSTGASVCMTPLPCDSALFIDINGKSSPNILGKDAFLLQLDPDSRGRIYDKDSSECSTSKGKYGCFSKIVEDGWTIK